MKMVKLARRRSMSDRFRFGMKMMQINVREIFTSVFEKKERKLLEVRLIFNTNVVCCVSWRLFTLILPITYDDNTFSVEKSVILCCSDSVVSSTEDLERIIYGSKRGWR